MTRISNSTDFECFLGGPDVSVDYVTQPPGRQECVPDAVFLPGTKSTVEDLAFLRSAGFEDYLRELQPKGVPITG